MRPSSPVFCGFAGHRGSRATLGSAADQDEATVVRRLLLPLLRPGMLILLDRAFDGNAFLAEIAGR